MCVCAHVQISSWVLFFCVRTCMCTLCVCACVGLWEVVSVCVCVWVCMCMRMCVCMCMREREGGREGGREKLVIPYLLYAGLYNMIINTVHCFVSSVVVFQHGIWNTFVRHLANVSVSRIYHCIARSDHSHSVAAAERQQGMKIFHWFRRMEPVIRTITL